MLIFNRNHDPRHYIAPETLTFAYIAEFGHKVVGIQTYEGATGDEQFYKDGIYMHVLPYNSFLGACSLLGRGLNGALNTIRKWRFVTRTFRREGCNLVFVGDQMGDELIAGYLKKRHRIPLVLHIANPLEQGWEIRKARRPNWPKYITYYVYFKLKAFVSTRALRSADLTDMGCANQDALQFHRP
jgi:hypothetical protein